MPQQLERAFYSSLVDLAHRQKLLSRSDAGGMVHLRYLKSTSDMTERLRCIHLGIFLSLLAEVDGSVNCNPEMLLSHLRIVERCARGMMSSDSGSFLILLLAGSCLLEQDQLREVLLELFEDHSILQTFKGIVRHVIDQAAQQDASRLDLQWAAIANLCHYSPAMSIELTSISLQLAMTGLDVFINVIEHSAHSFKMSCHHSMYWQLRCIISTMASIFRVSASSLYFPQKYFISIFRLMTLHPSFFLF